MRIVHVSDLHARGSAEPHAARRQRVLGDAWDTNLGEIRQTGEVDLLCFTGDLAFSGRDHEYGSMDEARPGLFTVSELVSRTIAALGLSRDQVYLAPGNHDIDRKINADHWTEFRRLNGTGTRADADCCRCGCAAASLRAATHRSSASS